jgi:hypothetical protein
MQISFDNLLLMDHYIDNILNHINQCICEGKEITYPNDGFNLAYILSTYRIFDEAEHLSMMTKWKYDSNLDLESAIWLIEYYLTGKEIIKSYLEDNEEVINAEFESKEKKDNITKIDSSATNVIDVLRDDANPDKNYYPYNNCIHVLPENIYIVDNDKQDIDNNNEDVQIDNNNEDIQNDNIDGDKQIDNIDDFISAFPSNKIKGKIIIK